MRCRCGNSRNVSGLLLLRGISRRREIALRASLGASRSRMIGQTVMESSLLAFFGGLLGFFLMWPWIGLVKMLVPDNYDRVQQIQIGLDALPLIFGVSVIATILVGLVPSLTLSRVRLALILKEGTAQGGSGGRNRRRLQSAFVIGQLAMRPVSWNR